MGGGAKHAEPKEGRPPSPSHTTASPPSNTATAQGPDQLRPAKGYSSCSICLFCFFPLFPFSVSCCLFVCRSVLEMVQT